MFKYIGKYEYSYIVICLYYSILMCLFSYI